ncbi:recombinase family protein [Streptomyces sp. NBC_00162]|uniref:recombinase family protein n=1 Tax=Streptomyces sp. NBC_00162 TaxID=2903629 RepID=UPI00214C2B50|nr:recombinase family protein [Streptomyces sp. NBC_00162]UUU44329.1 recombinase family protein [Streptomyces sp. NBC_00162]
MPTNPHGGGIGHVPVAVYSSSPDPATVRDSEACARRYAEARLWPVAGAWSDPDPDAPVIDRIGWRAITDALGSGMVRGIVVADPAHIAPDPSDFDRLGALVRDRGGFLVVATPSLPRRTASQHARRRNVLEAASGWSDLSDIRHDRPETGPDGP